MSNLYIVGKENTEGETLMVGVYGSQRWRYQWLNWALWEEDIVQRSNIGFGGHIDDVAITSWIFGADRPHVGTRSWCRTFLAFSRISLLSFESRDSSADTRFFYLFFNSFNFFNVSSACGFKCDTLVSLIWVLHI